jgi:hypothetical protein
MRKKPELAGATHPRPKHRLGENLCGAVIPAKGHRAGFPLGAD